MSDSKDVAGTPRRPRPAAWMLRLVAAALLAALVALVAGCSGGGENAASDAGAVQAEGGGRDGGSADSIAPEQAPRGANRTSVQTKSVIRTGQVAVTNEDLDRTRAEVDQLLFGFGGSIDKEQTSHDDDGNIERSTLTLRVPVANFEAAMDALEKLGKVETSESSSKNVTTEVIDVNERVQTLQNSLDRLQIFQRRSDDIDDLIRFEDQITERESQLRSLQAQQAYLADQTSMSTITLYLSTPEKYVAPPGVFEDAGFLAGLRSGWNALQDFVVVILTVFGAALPFALTVALVGVPVWVLVRVLARRRNATEATEAPAAADTPPEG